MNQFYAQLPDLVIPNATDVSQAIPGVVAYHDAVGLMIYSPSGLAESVYVEVNWNQEATNSDTGWVPYEVYDPATTSMINLFVPTAGKAQVYQEPVFAGSFRLKATTVVAEDRTFKCNKLFTTGQF